MEDLNDLILRGRDRYLVAAHIQNFAILQILLHLLDLFQQLCLIGVGGDRAFGGENGLARNSCP